MLVSQLSDRHILSEDLLFRQQFILSAEGEDEDHIGEEWTPGPPDWGKKGITCLKHVSVNKEITDVRSKILAHNSFGFFPELPAFTNAKHLF